MLNIIDNFYEPHDLGLMTLGFVNLPFSQTYHSKQWAVSDRNARIPLLGI